jgi:RimJ/RimL family protein N-acetyltransferase
MRPLVTPRLLLEPLVAAHADEMFVVLADPSIYAFENSPPRSLAWLRERYARLESRRSADRTEIWLNWVVRHVELHAAMGYVQATVFTDHTALIAYEFASAHWGRGFAREAVATMLTELAAAYRVDVVGAVFKRNNLRSRQLLEHLGVEPAAAPSFPCAHAAPDEDAMRMRLGPPPSPPR